MGADSILKHPYFPRDLSIPHYKPNKVSIQELLGIFFSLVLIVFIITWIYSTKKKFSVGYRLLLCWFTICGFIHTILEGYFAFNNSTLAGGSSYLAEMCKVCGKGDSRYITSDTFTVCMEGITAVIDGPLCFLTVAAYLTNSPYRYVLQLIVSLCQLYGDTLYLLTEVKDNFIHSELYHPLHFWFYFLFLNSFWIIVPLIMICHAVSKIITSQCTSDSRHNNRNQKKSR
ncbi:3-beta-hydroxysteroid-Delta(8),Delta(7)-isomerase-like [Mytilus trossulus]|uniref:3-beta-hydroxysteroid-Delta(8), Delta(7)-isomerase-like n=1 Tax=Mytilus trossulus TaxID=6551 RepID=UPI00300728F3